MSDLYFGLVVGMRIKCNTCKVIILDIGAMPDTDLTIDLKCNCRDQQDMDWIFEKVVAKNG